MDYYAFNPQTRAYSGVLSGDPSPLDPETIIQPAFTVAEQPPEPPAGFWPVLSGGDAFGVGSVWTLAEDHRGEVWFGADGEQVQIEALGPVPEVAVTQTPRPSYEHRWENGAWTIPPIDVAAIRVKPWPLRMALNQLGLRQQVEDAVAASTDQETKDAWQWASEFARSHPLVVGFGPLLNKSPAEVDQVFLLAHEIGRNMP